MVGLYTLERQSIWYLETGRISNCAGKKKYQEQRSDFCKTDLSEGFIVVLYGWVGIQGSDLSLGTS